MAVSRIENVRIAGIAGAVPGPSKAVGDDLPIPEAERAKIAATTGVFRRHLVESDICASDLCVAAAERLLDQTGWARESVDVLIFVSQTPDYVLPATACVIHDRLKLSPGCAAFDVNLGCSGYVYGLWLAASLLSSGAKRALLLAGDTVSRLVSPQDRSVAMLFGDAGTATALDSHPGSPAMHFDLGTDGSGQNHLIVPAGGFRRPRSPENGIRSEREGCNIRSDQDLFMNGGEIFAFTMGVVPQVCKAVLQRAAWPIKSLDGIVMHQANRFMLQHVARLIGAPKEKVVLALENYGNTSSASIPLAMTTLGEYLREKSAKLLLAGFGVGFSWGVAAVECGPVAMPPVACVETEASVKMSDS